MRIYKITNTFPPEEKFGLVSQIRRSAVSIPSNIAEGSKRGTDKDYAQFLRIAHGSGAELETQLLISKELGYIPEKVYLILERDLEETMSILASFIKKIS